MFNIDNITQYNACSDIESKNISYNLFGFKKILCLFIVSWDDFDVS